MELVNKWLSGEYMTDRETFEFQLRVGATRKALIAGKSVEDIAKILLSDITTAKAYITFVEEAESNKIR